MEAAEDTVRRVAGMGKDMDTTGPVIIEIRYKLDVIKS